jgi:signal transduction histidine kinase
MSDSAPLPAQAPSPASAADTLANKIAWYRSLYWRIALGFIGSLAVLLIVQAAVFVWLTWRTVGAFPTASNARLAAFVASDVRNLLEEDPAADLQAHIQNEYGRVAQRFVIVLRTGQVLSNQDRIPPVLELYSRNRLARLGARPFLRRGRLPPTGGREDAPIVVDGRLVGLVTVPPGRPAMAAVRTLGPTMAVGGLALLVVGAAAAALLIFRPVRRRLGQLQEAAGRIGAGDVAARAPERGGDEVAALARSFNRMAADLQARVEALAASDRARRQLLADVSHELMTPLTAMRGYIETLTMAELRLENETRERYLRIVDEETRRLERIIGDLLELSRLEGGGSALEHELVDIGQLFERIAERHERELRERRVTLLRRVDPGAEAVVGDADRLEQALQNLATNALKHTPDNGEISLSATPAGEMVRLAVRDTGPGISPEHLPLIFDRFYKADASRKTPGSGLGLSIVKAIIERHGGTIGAANAAGGGALFEMTLRRAAPSSRPSAPLTSS